MKIDFKDVKKLVNSYDIVGLIYEGGGDGEYDIETQNILDLVDLAENLDEVEMIVIRVFVDAFDEEIIKIPEREQCKKLASDIWNIIREKKSHR